MAAGCAAARSGGSVAPDVAGSPRMKVLILPPENLSGGPVPSKEWMGRLSQLVTMAGADVVGGDLLDEYLARYRIRYTGGVDSVAAQAARDDLGADAVLVTSIALAAEAPPGLALVLRLTSAEADPSVLWMDSYARAGDERPGLLGLGLVFDFQVLSGEALATLGKSMEAFLSGRTARAALCETGGWFRPRKAYRARPDERKTSTIAVLPFVNQTRRRGAGEILALEFAGQIANSEGYRLLEPGMVRDELLRRRIVMEDGVSIDQARTISVTMNADLVLAGYVFDYEDGGGNPSVNFTVQVLDRKTGRTIWQSTSFNRGSDPETVFGLNKVGTAPMLSCRMIREALDALAGVTSLPRS